MKTDRFTILLLLFICSQLAAKAQRVNPWLDSTQVNHSKIPLSVANGVIVSPNEVNTDFILSVTVIRDKQTNERYGTLAENGCIYLEADQQFDVVTPHLYLSKKRLPASVRTVVFMLNGHLVSDTLQISKGSIRRVDVLLGSNHVGVPADSACLSIWTLSDEERGVPGPKNELRIRGDQKAE
ncbi:hypothetical protein [Tellurirhabdus rosea]|uniref:hypothetical protein n=1 Tax=Tellurirhabdus rosea TaxID=2674997 RepID=UPI002252CAE3|nr:hypothetical protein [Tellurirhabdus rosea]